MNEPVSSIMSNDLLTIAPDKPLSEVKNLFKKKSIHHVPVVEGKKIVGLITTTDLYWLNKRFQEYEGMQASDVMTTKLATLNPDAKIGVAAQIFLRNWFHALPIVNEAGELLGIVTTFDILKYSFMKEYPGDEFPFS